MDQIKTKPVYSEEFKNNIVKRMLPPENINPKDLAKECNVSRTSLNNWLKKAKSGKIDETNKVEWVSVDITNEVKEKIVSKPIKINIGKVSIEVEIGFNKELLLEVLNVVTEI